MGYIVDTDEYVELKLNYVLTQMLEKENPDFDPIVSIELNLMEILCEIATFILIHRQSHILKNSNLLVLGKVMMNASTMH